MELVACQKLRSKTLNIENSKSRFNNDDTNPYKVEWRNNGDKYKVAPSSIRASVDIPNEVTKNIYAYHSVNGLRQRIAPREEGNIYDENWKPRITNVEMKERDDNNFDFNREDLGNSKREMR